MHTGQTITDLESLTERVMEFVTSSGSGLAITPSRQIARMDSEGHGPVEDCHHRCGRSTAMGLADGSASVSGSLPDSVCPADVAKGGSDPADSWQCGKSKLCEFCLFCAEHCICGEYPNG
jgi:hypothetical protein